MQICIKRAVPATLDGTPNQCSERLTDGEELKNRKVSPSLSQHCSIVLACHQGQVPSGWLRFVPPAWNLRTDLAGCLPFLQTEDGLLSEQDQELPFAGHIVRTLQHVDWIEHLIMVVLMGAQEVVVGDPERHVVVGAIVIIVATADPVSGFEGAVEPFDHLFVGTELLGDGIVVCEPDHLGDVKLEAFPRFPGELQGGQRIGAVSIRNEPKLLRETLHAPESHAHGEDTRPDRAVI